MCIVYSYIQLWIQSWSPFLVFSRSNVDVTHARDHAERIEWFIEDQALLRSYDSPSSSPLSRSGQQVFYLSRSSCVSGEGGWPPESLGLYKLFNILCMRPSHSCAKCAWWPLTTKYHFNYPSGAFIKGTESRDLLSGMLRRGSGYY